MTVTTLFLSLLRMSFAAAWLIPAVILLRLMLRRAPRRILCLLWLIVALRLVCPFTVESALSLLPRASLLPVEVQSAPAEVQTVIPSPQLPPTTVIPPPTADIAPLPTAPAAALTPGDIAALVWLGGCAVLVGYVVVSSLLIRRRVRVSLTLRDNIRLCDSIDTPFILGTFRPAIYLPSALDEDQAAYVIAHEQAHLARGDHFWKPLGFALLILHWFNPLVWVAYILFCRDIELACDERVTAPLSLEERKTYSAILLACSVDRRIAVRYPLAFGEVGVKARITRILQNTKPAAWLTALAVLLCIVTAVCFLTDPRTPASDDPPPPETTAPETTAPETTVPAETTEVPTSELPPAPVEITVADTFTAPQAVVDHAITLVENYISEYNEYGQSQAAVTGSTYTITEAKIIGINLIPTGTTGLTDSIELYQMECHLKPSQSDSVFLAGGMLLEDGWFKISQPYLILYHDWSSETETWSFVETIREDALGTTYGTDEMMAKYGNIYTAAAMELYAAYPGKKAPATEPQVIALTPESAQSFIDAALGTLALLDDNRVTFTLPPVIPTGDDATQLYVTLTATYGTGGSYSIQRLLNYADGWTGGQTYIGALEPSEGELTALMLRVAFMTKTEPNAMSQYAANYVELKAPFSNSPTLIAPNTVQITTNDGLTQLDFSLRGTNAVVTLALPDGFTLTAEPTDADDLPSLALNQNGTTIGSLDLFAFAAPDLQALANVDPAQNSLPMPIFATVALSNHAGYNDYTVRRSTATGASATAKYVWQNLTGNVPAAAVPFEQADSILAYDWSVMPYFLVLTLPDGTLPEAEYVALAERLTISGS